MRNPWRRGSGVPADVTSRAGLERGDRVLAAAEATEGTWLLGTRDALVLVGPEDVLRLPWEQVETAQWDREGSRLRVSEVGEFGTVRPVHVLTVEAPGDLLAMVRERVTASVLLQRRFPVVGTRGLRVIARRAPRGRGEITWMLDFDAGVDPEDPEVAEVARQGLRAAQSEVGSGPDAW